MKSTDFLQSAIDVQVERGKQYDSPAGERSMGRTVAAFNAITGRDLTEAEGWLILQTLKDVRQWQNPGQYQHDSALDGVAYASLKAEALHAAGEQERVPSEKTRRALDQARELRQQHDADMTDWRNWQVGDVVECTSDEYTSVVTYGRLYAITGIEGDRIYVKDNSGESYLVGDEIVEHYRWHSRPAP